MKIRSLFLGGFLGVLGVVSLFALINSSIDRSKKASKRIVSSFETKRIEKPRPKNLAKKKPKKKSKNLSPDLSNMLKGMSFGIPAFEIDFASGSDFLNNGNYVDGSKVDQKPKLSYRPELSFPSEALSQNISGYVTFGIFIDENGELKKVDVIESSPKGIFENVATENIKKWRFKPAVHKGINVATWQEQRIVFNAEES